MRHLFFIVLLVSLPLRGKTLAKLNGTLITQEEVQSLFPELKEDEALDRYLLYRLALTKAKQDGLNQTEAFRKKEEKLLYNEFLLTELSKNKTKLIPTEAELKAEYDKRPLYRVFHLALKGLPLDNKEKLEKIKKEISKGVPFEKLILKYSEDRSGAFRGDLDYKGEHNLSKDLYSLLQTLSKNTVSDPLYLDGATHLLQWTDKKTYGNAPESYLSYLKNSLQKQKEMAFLRTELNDLLKTAKIEKEEALP